MKKELIYMTLVVACALSAASCRSKKEDALASKYVQDVQKMLKPFIKEPGLSSTKEEAMIVKVNGATISRPEVESVMENILKQSGGTIPPDQLSQVRPMFWKQAVEISINQQILMQEAVREGIQPDKGAIDAEIAEITSRSPDPEKFQQLLASMGTSEQQFREGVGQNLKIKLLLDKKFDKIEEISDEQVNTFYRDNPKQFQVPEQVRASHILIASGPEDSEQERAQKRLKISGLLGEINKGADFAKVASEHSSCPSKSQGGDLGYFEKGRMAKPFEDAAFKMKAGEVSDIVETKFGYHLINLMALD